MDRRWQDRSVFVTGGTGLLGSWLVEELIARGASVIALIRDWVPQSLLLSGPCRDRIVMVRGCVEDAEVVERTLNEYGVETVFHLAAQTIVNIANRNPRSTFETNVKGTWNLLEACRRTPTIKRIIVASSDKAYGSQERLPYEETAPLKGIYPYDVSKSCADLIAASYFHAFGLPVCITRCGNLFGGGDLNFDRLVPGTIRSVLRGERPLIRSNGAFVRDYFYIKDAALAYLYLAEKMEELPIAGEAFNFSSERRLTALEMTQTILSLMGHEDLQPEILNQGHHEIPCQYLSAEKARAWLGWVPRYDLNMALKETVQWYANHLNAKSFDRGQVQPAPSPIG